MTDLLEAHLVSQFVENYHHFFCFQYKDRWRFCAVAIAYKVEKSQLRILEYSIVLPYSSHTWFFLDSLVHNPAIILLSVGSIALCAYGNQSMHQCNMFSEGPHSGKVKNIKGSTTFSWGCLSEEVAVDNKHASSEISETLAFEQSSIGMPTRSQKNWIIDAMPCWSHRLMWVR